MPLPPDPSQPQRAFPSLAQRRVAFWTFALALFIGTHWPALKIHVRNVERPDLLMHIAIFAVWYLLLFAAMYFTGLGRWRSLVVMWVVAVAYAAFDEALQAIPAIRRTAAWDDLAANVAGITLGLIAAAGWTFTVARPARNEPGTQ